jgi:hypothetical protein
MKNQVAVAVIALAGAFLAGRVGAAAPMPAGTVEVRSNMVEGINPAALAIRDVGSDARAEDGGLDPARMDSAAWSKLADAAESLGTYAHRLAAAKVIRIEGLDLVGGKVPEGVSTQAQIQAMIDANPAGFRASATVLEQQAKALAAAADKHDVKASAELMASFDQACQACHQNYWYRKP